MTWQKGQSGNPAGRKPREAERNFLALLSAAVTRQDWVEIADKAVKQAKGGNAEARKWLSSYLMGLPVQRIEQSGPNGGPQTLVIEYVNDWRQWAANPAAEPASGPGGGEDAGAPVQLAGSG